MARRNEEERLIELTKIEREYWAKGILPAGMDEVGRGPLAGPVVTPDKDTLLEPVWLTEKCQLLNDIDKEMTKRNTYQGINL